MAPPEGRDDGAWWSGSYALPRAQPVHPYAIPVDRHRSRSDRLRILVKRFLSRARIALSSGSRTGSPKAFARYLLQVFSKSGPEPRPGSSSGIAGRPLDRYAPDP